MPAITCLFVYIYTENTDKMYGTYVAVTMIDLVMMYIMVCREALTRSVEILVPFAETGSKCISG